MGKNATVPVAVATLFSIGLWGQVTADWRHIGNTSIELGLAGLASGPVDRVWYSADGQKLTIRTSSGKTFETSDFEKWQAAAAPLEPAGTQGSVRSLPENGALTRKPVGQTPRVYAMARFAYRSDDEGASWENLTGYRSVGGLVSIVGNGLRDLAVSPANQDDVAVASTAGVFRSLDGGKSWAGLNQGLPNLETVRFRGLPAGTRGVRLELPGANVVEWQPGEKQAWRPADNTDSLTELQLRQALGSLRGGNITAITTAGDFVYTGFADGRLSVSGDGGRSWQDFAVTDGTDVAAIWVDANDSRLALATVNVRPTSTNPAPTRVLRTVNGGAFWDDISANLSLLAGVDSALRGITADRASGAVYVASSRGVFYARADFNALAAPVIWQAVAGLPSLSAVDVRLDASANQLWAAIEGFGVYSTLAPHRLGDPRVVSAADFAAHPVAPGSLVSVTGAKIDSARTGSLAVPVLAATDSESQLQIPFNARGDALSLALDTGGGRRVLGPLALGATAPAIFIDRDGSPLLMDGDSGVLLDAMHPAHSRARIQILAAGLGLVSPDWPAGVAAPLENPPQVVAKVNAWIDRNPAEVTRAVLAPGYVGIYLVEIEVPKTLNFGPAELYIEAGAQASNRVRIFVEP